MPEAKQKRAKKFSATVLAVALAVADAGSVPALATDAGNGCADAVAISPNDRHRGLPGQAGETFCHRIVLDTTGVLLVHAATPGIGEAEAKLRLRDRAEAGEAEAAIVERSAAHLLLRIRKPGSYVFEIASQDPRTAHGEYTFISRFDADADAVAVKFAKAEPFSRLKGGADGEIDPILIVSTPVDGPPEVTLYDLCRPDLTDDHDDLFACASPVHPDEWVHGEIVNDWTDDYDVFTFYLAEQRTVWFETRGGVDTVGTVYDLRGHRLAAAAGGGVDGNFRLVRTLAPGRYFLRIEGRSGSQGPYSLILGTLPW
ncbi:MAG: hypothetical protein GY856_35500 [bacterium]|nr:hypothetical protein [bacterium]